MFEGATAEQAHAILAAAHRVVQQHPVADDPRSGRGDGVVVAAGRLLFRPAVHVDEVVVAHNADPYANYFDLKKSGRGDARG